MEVSLAAVDHVELELSSLSLFNLSVESTGCILPQISTPT